MTKAKIYKPGKTAMQSGRAKTQNWILEYDLPSERAPESLMGWTASSDTLNQVRLKFKTQKDAVAFAKKEGLVYSIEVERTRVPRPRNYGDNFKYIPVEG